MSIQYQDFLLEEFRSRRSRNVHYSLRAFARDIGMPASKLSQNLRGLCGISVAKAACIAGKLQMRDDEKQLFLALVESQHARSRVARQQAALSLHRIRSEKIDEMTLEMFSTVRDWYHLVILEMVDVRGFRPEAEWIAAQLELPIDVIQEAVERLRHLGLLDTSDTERWRQTQKDLGLPNGAPKRAIREHHKQILSKASAAIDLKPERCEYSSQTFAFDPSRINEVKDLIHDFQRKLTRLHQDGDKSAVFMMALQLFPVVEPNAVIN